MDYYRISLIPKTAFGTPLQGDTLFGHLCWALRYNEGVEALESFLGDQENSPRILLSDGFIDDQLPRPVLMPLPRPAEVTKEEAREFKRRKKIRFLSRSLLEEIRDTLSPERLDEQLEREANEQEKNEMPFYRERSRMRIRIDRFIDSVPEGGLFQESETTYSPDVQLTVYAGLNGFDLQAFEDLMHAVSLTGYGRDAGVGLGAFDIARIEKVDPLVRDGDTHLMTLSACVPSRSDPTDALYDIMTKYGKLGGLYARKGWEDAPIALKKPLIMLRAGAMFARRDPTPYVGHMVRGTYPPNPKILHYGYGLCWGFRMAGKEAAA